MVLSLFSVEATRIGFGSLTQKVGSRTVNRNLQTTREICMINFSESLSSEGRTKESD